MPWQKGQSGNPGGRQKEPENIKVLARTYTMPALKTLAEICAKGRSELSRVNAAIALLDRAWGKPTQPIAGDRDMDPIGVEHSDARTELVGRIAALVARGAEGDNRSDEPGRLH